MRKRGIAILMALALATTPVVGISQNTLAVKAAAQQTNVNLIKNGDFNNGTAEWNYFTTEGGKGTMSASNGKLVLNVDNCGTVNYSMQAYYEGFGMYKNGVYELSFDISSSIPRSVDYRIQLNGGDYTGYYDGNVKTNNTAQRVNVKFTMKEANDPLPRLCFSVGNCGASLPAHQVYLDNVSLKLLDGSQIQYDEEKKAQEININQLGYKTADQKIAVFRGSNVGSSFSVVNTATNKTVYTGTIGSGQFNSLAGETDYKGDFSKVTTPGTYKIVSNGLMDSYEFKIADDVYQETFTDAMRFFYLQRCEEIPASLGGDFAHPACHQSKAKIYGTNNYIDVSGGWHDAGDYGRYVVATSKAVSDILLAYQANKAAFTDNTNIPESGNGQADVLDELKGQFEWMLKMQDQNNGGVHHKVTCADFPAYVSADKETAELIVTPISTTATGDFAACMALAYDTYKDIDPSFAKTCLEAAKKAWNYLSTAPSQGVNNPQGIVTGSYEDKSDRDERYYAAAALYYVTGENTYHQAVKNLVNQGLDTEYGWQTVTQYGNVLYLKSANQDASVKQKIESKITSDANDLLRRSQNDPYGTSIGNNFIWGSNMVTLNNANVLMDAYNITGNEAYKTAAIEHVNYVYGKNSMGTSYVTGYGTVSPQNPHHRPSMVAKKAIKGALVGGPNSALEDGIAKNMCADAAPANCYVDHAECYSTNEVDIYWNSALVLSLARMDRLGTSTNVQPSVAPSVKPSPSVPSVAPSVKPSPSVPSVAPSVKPSPSVQPSVAPSVKPSPSVQPSVAPSVKPSQPAATEGVSTSGIKVTQTTTGAGSLNQVYKISNTGSSAIDLSKLEITYRFTKDDSKDMNLWCDNAAAQLNVAPYYVSFTSGVKATISKSVNEYVINIKFTDSFSFAPNSGYVEIQSRFANNDWSNVSGYKEVGMQVSYNGTVIQA